MNRLSTPSPLLLKGRGSANVCNASIPFARQCVEPVLHLKVLATTIVVFTYAPQRIAEARFKMRNEPRVRAIRPFVAAIHSERTAAVAESTDVESKAIDVASEAADVEPKLTDLKAKAIAVMRESTEVETKSAEVQSNSVEVAAKPAEVGAYSVANATLVTMRTAISVRFHV